MVKKDDLIEIPELYSISIIIDEYIGYRDVCMNIIRDSKPPFDPKKYVPDCIPDSKKGDIYVLGAIEECFTMDEVKKIGAYLQTLPKTHIMEPRVCELPISGDVVPTVALPAGGGCDFYLFSDHEEYPLGNLKISGYFDLRGCRRVDDEK